MEESEKGASVYCAGAFNEQEAAWRVEVEMKGSITTVERNLSARGRT